MSIVENNTHKLSVGVAAVFLEGALRFRHALIKTEERANTELVHVERLLAEREKPDMTSHKITKA